MGQLLDCKRRDLYRLWQRRQYGASLDSLGIAA
jgi:hypothetical protein